MNVQSTVTNRTAVPRVTVDPNSVSRLHPEWSAALFEEATIIPSVGQTVLVVQPEDVGPDYVGRGIVKLLDLKHELLYIDVDWSSFMDEVPELAIVASPQIEFTFSASSAQPRLTPQATGNAISIRKIG